MPYSLVCFLRDISFVGTGIQKIEKKNIEVEEKKGKIIIITE